MPQKAVDIILYGTAGLVVIGCFLPSTNHAVLGVVSYFDVALYEALFVIFFAFSAVVFVYLKKQKFTMISIEGIWLALLFPAILKLLADTDPESTEAMDRIVSGPLDAMADNLFLDVPAFAWGGFLFLLGILLITFTSVLAYVKSQH